VRSAKASSAHGIPSPVGIGPIDTSAARAIAGPDLDPIGDGSECASISIGLGLELAPASEVP
jgi:hypothetical protein